MKSRYTKWQEEETVRFEVWENRDWGKYPRVFIDTFYTREEAEACATSSDWEYVPDIDIVEIWETKLVEVEECPPGDYD